MDYIAVQLVDIKEAQQKLSELRGEYWLQEVVFSFQWWFLLISMLLIGLLWLRIVDRKMLRGITLYGVITLGIVMFLDVFGAELVLWDYPAMVLPWGSRIIFINMIISIVYMLLYQCFPAWNRFILASAVTALIFAFVLEPLAIYMNIYEPYTWEHIYSFPIYILLPIIIKWVVDKIYLIERTNQEKMN
ncbi:CBO0543 family protein [Lentibacillus sediminis]|uniref:CBO0543 family protein n=1 Tax=Lentibacillus sediminis TaxID=1940529 RepID=UPI000C1BFF1C|nr:CBO0543 family protein [Lentibacillus sediminis]